MSNETIEGPAQADFNDLSAALKPHLRGFHVDPTEYLNGIITLKPPEQHQDRLRNIVIDEQLIKQLGLPTQANVKVHLTEDVRLDLTISPTSLFDRDRHVFAITNQVVSPDNNLPFRVEYGFFKGREKASPYEMTELTDLVAIEGLTNTVLAIGSRPIK